MAAATTLAVGDRAAAGAGADPANGWGGFAKWKLQLGSTRLLPDPAADQLEQAAVPEALSRVPAAAPVEHDLR